MPCRIVINKIMRLKIQIKITGYAAFNWDVLSISCDLSMGHIKVFLN